MTRADPTTQPVPQLTDDRAEAGFDDYKPPYDRGAALVEANRCLYCEDAPCIQACPTEINIPEFIRKIATDNVWGSARTIFESNILGMSCARVCPVETLCVGDCVFNHMDQPPIQIGKLQRYSTDIAYEKGWTFFEAGPDTGKTVGIIGAGPGGLAAAHRLRRYGHGVTIYEKRQVIGGLNTTGVAPYKMKADRSVDEVNWILGIGGIAIETDVEIGAEGHPSFADLEAKHDAVIIGFGLGPDRLLDGAESLAGVHGAVDYIEDFKLGQVDVAGVNNAVVLGGGNTALDCIRELRRLAPEAQTTMVYRGTEPKMSGYLHEWRAAQTEGCVARWQTQPTGFESEGGRVTGVQCIRVDENKQLVPGTEHVIAADLVLLAIGQSKLGNTLAGIEGIHVEWGRLVVDAGQATDRPGVYAVGDCANGGKEVVNAAAEGKRAAEAIHAFLNGGGK